MGDEVRGKDTSVSRAGGSAGVDSGHVDATTSRSVLVAGLWNVPGRMVPAFYALVTSVVAARVLGPDLMGRLSLLTFVGATLLVFVSVGVNNALVRYIGESLGRGRPDAVRALVRWAWRIEGAGAAVAAAALVAIALAGGTPRTGWLVVAVATAIGALHSVPSALLLGAQRWRQAVTVSLATGSVHTVTAIVVLTAGGGVVGLLVVDALIGLVNLVWTMLLARRELGRLPAAEGEPDDLRPRVTRFALFATVGLAFTFVLERRSEVVFLAWFSTDAEIALYSIPFSALAMAILIPAAIAGVTSPAIATLYGAGALDRVRAGHERALRLTMLVTLPLTAASFSLGPALLRLVYGDEYRGTGPVLLVLLVSLPAAAVTMLSGSLLTGLAQVRVQVAMTAAAAVVNVALNLALVPAFAAVGAAAAHSTASVCAGALLFVAASRALGGISVGASALLPGAAAAGGAGLAAWALVELLGGGATGIAAGFVVGALLLALLARVARIVPAEDAEWLRGMVGDRFGGRAARALVACARPPARARA
jgi:O-antigen/teichoic acid export membrane protein